MGKTFPVIQLFSLSISNSIILIRSWGVPILPRGCIFSLAFNAIGLEVIPAAKGVSIKLGAITLKRRFFFAYVAAADRAKPSTPALAAAIASWFFNPIEAAALEISTTDAFSKSRPVDRTTLKDVFKFWLIVNSNSSFDVLWAGFKRMLPARFITPSISPKFSIP